MEKQVNFIQNDFPLLMEQLEAETPAQWGKMNARQMVEHLADFFKVSSGKKKFDLTTPADQLTKFKAFLYTDKGFRENTKAPMLPEEPFPVRNASFEQSKAELMEEMAAFFEAFQTDPERVNLHPVFGELNYEEWIRLHYKHLIHHCRQFGLSPLPEQAG